MEQFFEKLKEKKEKYIALEKELSSPDLLSKREEYKKNLSRFPEETVAHILVLSTRDHVSTGVVTRSFRAVEIGDRIKMPLGK